MRLGLIGYGAIGRGLLGLLKASDGVDAIAVLVRNGREGGLPATAADGAPVTAATDAEGLLAERPDLVVECAGHGAAAEIVPAILRAGTDVILVSVGAMADAALAAELTRAAKEGGARLVLPAGAIGGIDLLSAAAAGGNVSVSYTGRKPPAAWAGSPAEEVVDLSSLEAATPFFVGTARSAATEYPKNANVAATLALAGAGFENTRVTLIADPAAPGNVHEYEVTSAVADFSVRIVGKSSGNARTSMGTIYSVLREIRNRTGTVVI